MIYQLYSYQINLYDSKKKNPTGTVLYTIEQTIKEYRKICQKNIGRIVSDITVDQCLVLIILNENSDFSQKEIAELVFKDNASVTRIIELMVKNHYLTRDVHESDRRKFNLKITEKGKTTIDLLTPVIKQNRKTALDGLSANEIELLDKILCKIISNCRIS
ncbi:MarR family winged helix-turn-helix transcriptional regulator [Pedobacter sp. NJ-S-72]